MVQEVAEGERAVHCGERAAQAELQAEEVAEAVEAGRAGAGSGSSRA
eukprot:COSAG02_NODE_1575_length_11877_cov_43.830871_1_plen_47_part_00